MAKPRNQPIGVRFVSTIALILSVTDANVVARRRSTAGGRSGVR